MRAFLATFLPTLFILGGALYFTELRSDNTIIITPNPVFSAQ